LHHWAQRLDHSCRSCITNVTAAIDAAEVYFSVAEIAAAPGPHVMGRFTGLSASDLRERITKSDEQLGHLEFLP
jgi:hypothetical protein